jgi:heat shock protein HslJ
MTCEQALMDQERTIVRALESVNRFEIDEVGTLVLLAGDDRTLSARKK